MTALSALQDHPISRWIWACPTMEWAGHETSTTGVILCPDSWKACMWCGSGPCGYLAWFHRLLVMLPSALLNIGMSRFDHARICQTSLTTNTPDGSSLGCLNCMRLAAHCAPFPGLPVLFLRGLPQGFGECWVSPSRVGHLSSAWICRQIEDIA
jgi:hypothetical protein